ncbi:L-rhamnose isomerase [Candidatus Izemoplasma sp. B36]|uniref:L-rhamnose isomerase n=1 Tax=Candidatus Izemoplasma sp. B36 TaxID=3242468 RepID=UPI003558AB58
MDNTLKNYEIAKRIYKQFNIDTDKAINILKDVPISLNCWQLDDIKGFEKASYNLSGGISTTGNNKSAPSGIKEFKAFAREVIKDLPGKKKFNLHSIYLDSLNDVSRDQIKPEHFSSWVDFAKKLNIGLDFNATCFSHPNFKDGYTIAHNDPSVRKFWINHIKQCRKISEYFGKELGIRSIHNIWVPDGSKDETVDALYRRQLLKESLDEILKEKCNSKYMIDSVESKLFGIGSESYVVGSHDFYLNYVNNNKDKNLMLCMDMGHYHPTEKISDKISAMIPFHNELLIHVSRPIRWDSDHIVLFDDNTKDVMKEIVRANAINKVHIAIDSFDASVDRRKALKIGAENVIKALLYALLEPTEQLRKYERESDLTSRLELFEEIKTLPFGFVWEYYKKAFK